MLTTVVMGQTTFDAWLTNAADPFSMAPQKALESIGKSLSCQYERWQPKVGESVNV